LRSESLEERRINKDLDDLELISPTTIITRNKLHTKLLEMDRSASCDFHDQSPEFEKFPESIR
jgi:hypothetical protein